MPADDPLPSLADELVLLTAAVEAAANLALRLQGEANQVWSKAGGSPVSAADLAVEKLLSETLRAQRPTYGWLSEETEDDGSRLSARRSFVADPIDGTRAFISGATDWTVPVALIEDGRPIVAVVAAPRRGELYRAVRGGGATLDGSAIAVSRRDRLDGGRFAVSRRYLREGGVSIAARTEFYTSLAYRLCRVADGRLDGAVVRPAAQDWDLAAADLILHEAGGVIRDHAGRPPRYDRPATVQPGLVAASPVIAAELAAMMAARPDRMDVDQEASP